MLISSNYHNLMYLRRAILIALAFFVLSVVAMRVPTAYQLGYHSDRDIELSIDNLTNSSPELSKVVAS
jgi:hypothetical protein